MNCWHCQGSRLCNCIFCGKDTRRGREFGECLTCVGREFVERHCSILEAPANDPLKRENYDYHPAADGNKAYRVYKPFKGLK